MLYLRTFGGLSLAGAPPTAGAAGVQRKPLALLALLAASEPLGLSRDQVLAFLWSERDEEHGRSALRQTLHALRRALTAPDLFLGGEDLRLNPALISSDIAEFIRASTAADFAAMAGLYRGPFLDGFHIAEAPEFERWTERQRSQLAIRARDALEALARQAVEEGDPLTASRWLRQAATIEPTNGRIALALMRALVAAGNRGGALQHARVYETLVREELDAPVDPEVPHLAEQLRREAAPGHPSVSPSPAVAAAGRPPPVPVDPAPAALPTPLPDEEARRRSARPMAALLLGLVGVAMVAAMFRYLDRRQRGVLDPTVLAVVPFVLFESDLEGWREGLAEVLARNLDGAGDLRTVNPRVVIRAAPRGLEGVSPTAIGRRVGAGTILAGSLIRAGPDSVRATVSVLDSRNGVVLDEIIRSEANERMDRLADSLTLGVIRALASRGIASTGLRTGIHSTSLEAVKLFLRGEHHFRDARWDSARFYYERAVGLDSSMALAYRRLGHVLTWQRVNFDSLASLMLLRAGQHNQGLGPRDSLLVRCDSLGAAANETADVLLSWNLGRDLLLTARQATEEYPEDPEAWYALADAEYHFAFGGLSVPESEILEAFDRVIKADSSFAPAYLHASELVLNTRGRKEALRYIGRYLALQPVDASEPGMRLLAAILRAPADSSEVRQLLDTASAEALSLARTMLRAWPDANETAVRLSRVLAQGRPSTYQLFADTARMRRRLSEQLAFRGHLREAYTVLGTMESGLFAELAILGAVPPDSARAAFRRWQQDRSELLRFAFPWWASRRDTTALQRSVAEARTRMRGAVPGAAFEASYDTAAGLAYLALARGDSADALFRFGSLPDSACVRCYVDRLTRARLLASHGRPAEAMADLQERLVAYSSPFQVLFAAERAKVGATLGRMAEVREHRRFVQQAWLHADQGLSLPPVFP